MFLLGSETAEETDQGDLIFSASDLVVASGCEYQSLRILDEKLGWTPKANFARDEMMARAAVLGDAYEERVLQKLTENYGRWDAESGKGVKEIARPANMSAAALEEQREATLEVLRAGADVVFQATFFDGQFLGFADFLVREPSGEYAVWDTKLARYAKVSALLQLAAYGDQLLKYGIQPAPLADLVLGTGEHSQHRMADILPVFRERRERFLELTSTHRAARRPVEWLQPGISYCGQCDYCKEQIVRTNDLLLVNGMTSARRRKLRAQGIETVVELAQMPAKDATGPLTRLRDQARMQRGLEPGVKTIYVGAGASQRSVSFKVLDKPSPLPPSSQGDIFFDFEGDPLWQSPVDGSWGIEYLFGSIEAPVGDAPPVFTAFWAHSREQERKAFEDFVDYVEARRATHPDMHVYHYAPYEKSALRRLSVDHGVREDTIDDWLRTGLLVDLLDSVRQSVRISESSYSIKKLEPFYMDTLRDGDVKDAGASVVAYADYCEQNDAGRAGDTDQAALALTTLASIRDYNEYDCLSTLHLRNWLLFIKAATITTDWTQGSGKLAIDDPPKPPVEREILAAEATITAFLDARYAQPGHVATADELALSMVQAAASYHRRENKQFWWGHYDRIEKSPQDWAPERNLLVIERAEQVSDWEKATPRARTEARVLKLSGTASEGSDFRPGTSWFGMYAAPLPDGLGEGSSTLRLRDGIFNMTVLEDVSDPITPDVVTLLVQEKSSGKVPPHGYLPIALTPNQPIATKSIQAALEELATQLAAMLPPVGDLDSPIRFPKHPGVEILRKALPRLLPPDAASPAPADGNAANLPAAVVSEESGRADYISAITAAVKRLNGSYLAVQGPPGTGKTHVGSHVIAQLVELGWKIGVVGQSHAVVENMLSAAVSKAGVDPERVGKPKNGTHEVPWKITDQKHFGKLLEDDGGALIGGTAWTMTGANVPAGSLDLLVIDEAGQYSLANTLAVAQSAKRLLLLGDPQQLPQVTQGSHPVPVDESALGWLSAGHSTLPESMGYFLADSWRMYPDLCRAVSRLSYEGKLLSAPAAGERYLEGAAPGVHSVIVPVDPSSGRENIQSSPEEAAEVVAQVRYHLGLAWTSGVGAAPRPLEQGDVVVVAAYNAQVHLIRDALAAAGLDEVKVGTVDKFQGQEAPVVLISMACADPTAAPRGMEFLLNRNRINVAVSRGQWRAVILRSPQLTNFMPSRPAALEELGGFIGLCSGS